MCAYINVCVCVCVCVCACVRVCVLLPRVALGAHVLARVVPVLDLVVRLDEERVGVDATEARAHQQIRNAGAARNTELASRRALPQPGRCGRRPLC